MSTAVENSEDTLPRLLAEPNTQATLEEPNGSSNNGVVVKVTQHPLEKPLNPAAAADGSLQLLGGRATPTDLLGDDMAKGLSCLSLEVMTSGEHLDALSSLDDLSSNELGSGSDRGSSPGSGSMGEDEGRGRGSSPGSASMEEERENRDLQANDEIERGSGNKEEQREKDDQADEKSPNDVITAVVEGKRKRSLPNLLNIRRNY